jgi:5-hydroxyisourate hydrolase-like protein (transthyretin family)
MTTIAIFLTFIGIILSIDCKAQTGGKEKEKVYQLTGLVLNRVTGAPIPYTKITINKRLRMAYTNEEGFYSLPVEAGDTVNFFHVGFYPAKLPIADYLKNYKPDTEYLYEIQFMLEDTITLPTVTIYPYKTPDDIKNAIKYMNTPIDIPIDQAQAHITPELMSFFMNNLPTDPNDAQNVARQRYMQYYSNTNVRPTFGVDFVAVYNLINYIGKKKKEKQDRILNSDVDY